MTPVWWTGAVPSPMGRTWPVHNDRQPDDRADMDDRPAPILVGGLEIIAGSPTSLTGKRHLAPAIAVQASTNGERRTGRDCAHAAILRTWTGSHVHVARRISIGRFSQGGKRHSQQQGKRCRNVFRPHRLSSGYAFIDRVNALQAINHGSVSGGKSVDTASFRSARQAAFTAV